MCCGKKFPGSGSAEVCTAVPFSDVFDYVLSAISTPWKILVGNPDITAGRLHLTRDDIASRDPLAVVAPCEGFYLSAEVELLTFNSVFGFGIFPNATPMPYIRGSGVGTLVLCASAYTMTVFPLGGDWDNVTHRAYAGGPVELEIFWKAEAQELAARWAGVYFSGFVAYASPVDFVYVHSNDATQSPVGQDARMGTISWQAALSDAQVQALV